MNPSKALHNIPASLRNPLLKEYRSIIQNYAEHRWSPSELSGGRFCEVVYSILVGYGEGDYPTKPQKPPNFVSACRKLETNTKVPRSFQILLPRALLALYEIRNNRGVGHVGGDVDPNHMDATLVVSMCNWILAELVRVFHDLSIDDARRLIDNLVERRIPIVWHGTNTKRVLDPKMNLKNQILLLIASVPEAVNTTELQLWCDYNNKAYFFKLLREMHKDRLLELSTDSTQVEILPPGNKMVEQILYVTEETI